MNINHIDHPFYCVWCGETLPDKETFERHYQNELNDEREITDEEVFDKIHNPKNY